MINWYSPYSIYNFFAIAPDISVILINGPKNMAEINRSKTRVKGFVNEEMD